MNANGVFCFVLVLAFISFYLVFLNSGNDAWQEIRGAKQVAFEAEKANLLRTNLENNADFLIQETIKKEIKKGNSDAKKLREKIAERLFLFFTEMEKVNLHETKIAFFSGSFSKQQYKKILFFKREKKLEKKEIIENSKVLVKKIANQSYFVEFNFTGGLFKNTVIYTVFSSPNYEQIFLIPIDYTQTVTVPA